MARIKRVEGHFDRFQGKLKKSFLRAKVLVLSCGPTALYRLCYGYTLWLYFSFSIILKLWMFHTVPFFLHPCVEVFNTINSLFSNQAYLLVVINSHTPTKDSRKDVCVCE